MNELISLARENAFVVIGLLLVALYLQDRMHGESLAVRQEIALLGGKMSAEITAVRQEMSGEIAAVKQEMSAEIAVVRHEMSGEIAAVRQEMSAEMAAVRQEISGLGERLARIETLIAQLLLEEQAQ